MSQGNRWKFCAMIPIFIIDGSALVGIWWDVITGIYHGWPNCRDGGGDHSSPPW